MSPIEVWSLRLLYQSTHPSVAYSTSAIVLNGPTWNGLVADQTLVDTMSIKLWALPPIALSASALLVIPFLAAPPAEASRQESFITPGLTAWTVPGGITEAYGHG
jgi:hypothetical protein